MKLSALFVLFAICISPVLVTAQEEGPYRVVERMPAFPGCEEEEGDLVIVVAPTTVPLITIVVVAIGITFSFKASIIAVVFKAVRSKPDIFSFYRHSN